MQIKIKKNVVVNPNDISFNDMIAALPPMSTKIDWSFNNNTAHMREMTVDDLIMGFIYPINCPS
jgi:hypothetical protein